MWPPVTVDIAALAILYWAFFGFWKMSTPNLQESLSPYIAPEPTQPSSKQRANTLAGWVCRNIFRQSGWTKPTVLAAIWLYRSYVFSFAMISSIIVLRIIFSWIVPPPLIVWLFGTTGFLLVALIFLWGYCVVRGGRPWFWESRARNMVTILLSRHYQEVTEIRSLAAIPLPWWWIIRLNKKSSLKYAAFAVLIFGARFLIPVLVGFLTVYPYLNSPVIVVHTGVTILAWMAILWVTVLYTGLSLKLAISDWHGACWRTSDTFSLALLKSFLEP